MDLKIKKNIQNSQQSASFHLLINSSGFALKIQECLQRTLFESVLNV